MLPERRYFIFSILMFCFFNYANANTTSNSCKIKAKNQVELLAKAIDQEDEACFRKSVLNKAFLVTSRTSVDKAYLDSFSKIGCESSQPMVCVTFLDKIKVIPAILDIIKDKNFSYYDRENVVRFLYFGAVKADRVSTIQELHRQGFKLSLNVSIGGTAQETLFWSAGVLNSLASAKELLKLNVIDFKAVKDFFPRFMYNCYLGGLPFLYKEELGAHEYKGCDEITKFLIKNYPIDINYKYLDDESIRMRGEQIIAPYTPLRIIIMSKKIIPQIREGKSYKYLPMVKLLIDSGADLNDEEVPALLLAGQACSPDLAKLLLINKADPNIKSPMEVEFKQYYSRTPVITTALIAISGSRMFLKTPNECIETAKVLIDGGADVNIMGISALGRAMTALDATHLFRITEDITKEKPRKQIELCEFLRKQKSKTAQELLVGPHNFDCN